MTCGAWKYGKACTKRAGRQTISKKAKKDSGLMTSSSGQGVSEQFLNGTSANI